MRTDRVSRYVVSPKDPFAWRSSSEAISNMSRSRPVEESLGSYSLDSVASNGPLYPNRRAMLHMSSKIKMLPIPIGIANSHVSGLVDPAITRSIRLGLGKLDKITV